MQHTFPTPEPVELWIEVGRGRVRVTTSDVDETSIRLSGDQAEQTRTRVQRARQEGGQQGRHELMAAVAEERGRAHPQHPDRGSTVLGRACAGRFVLGTGVVGHANLPQVSIEVGTVGDGCRGWVRRAPPPVRRSYQDPCCTA